METSLFKHYELEMVVSIAWHIIRSDRFRPSCDKGVPEVFVIIASMLLLLQVPQYATRGITTEGIVDRVLAIWHRE